MRTQHSRTQDSSLFRRHPKRRAPLMFEVKIDSPRLHQKHRRASVDDSVGPSCIPCTMITRGSQTLTWNIENQLVSVTGGVTMFAVYDGFGNRVKKTAAGALIRGFFGVRVQHGCFGRLTGISCRIPAGQTDLWGGFLVSYGSFAASAPPLGYTRRLLLMDSATMVVSCPGGSKFVTKVGQRP